MLGSKGERVDDLFLFFAILVSFPLRRDTRALGACADVDGSIHAAILEYLARDLHVISTVRDDLVEFTSLEPFRRL